MAKAWCFFLLPARLVAELASRRMPTNWTAAGAALNLTSGAACRAECIGLRAYEIKMQEVMKDKNLNQAQICHALQAEFTVARCVLNFPGTCIAYYDNFYKQRQICKKDVGVDVTKEPIKSNYTSLTCQMCVESAGASRKNTYWKKPELRECEAHCSNDADCAVFDYDATTSMCRTWIGCAEAGRSQRFGCQWTVYLRPGFVAPKPKQGAIPTRPPNFDFFSTAPTTTRHLAVKRNFVALASGATSCRGTIASWKAIIGVCLYTVLLAGVSSSSQ